MAEPDVRVRLSAEGTAEVIAAFRKIQAEADRSGRASSKAFSGVSSSLSSVRGLLTGVASAVAAIGLARLVAQASDAGEQLQNLQQRFSGTVEDLSALSVAARQTGSDMGQLARPLTKLFNEMSEASRDLTGEAADRFRDFGLSTKEIENFAKQDLAGRIETLAKAFGKIPEGPERSNVAIRLLGDRGAALIPILSAVAEQGFGGLRAGAERLSSLMNKDVVQATGAVNDAFDDLRIQSEGLASQFLTGLAPAFTTSMGIMEDELSRGGQAWRDFGEIVGNVVGFSIVAASNALDSLTTHLTNLSANIASTVRAVGAFATGKFEEARLHAEAPGLRNAREEELLAERVNRAWDRFFHREEVRARDRADLNAESLDRTAKNEEASTKARIAAHRAAIDADLALTRAGLKLRESFEQEAFEEGTRSLAENQATRRRLMLTEINAEIAALQKQRTLALTDREKGPAEAEKIDGQISTLALERQGKLSTLRLKEREENRSLAQERLELDKKVFEARGNQHAATLLGIEEEIRKADELLKKFGTEDAERNRALQDLRTALTTAAEFERTSAEATRELSELSRERAAIERRAAAGLISQTEANVQLRDLEESRIGRLREIAGELERGAGNDPDRTARARDFSANVDEVEVSLAGAADSTKRLGVALENAGVGGLQEFFSTGIQGATSFADAWKRMALSVVDSLRQVLAQILATQIASALLGGIFGGGGGSKIGAPTISGDFGPITAAAEGGLITGPGGPTSDSVPALLSAGEYVVRASAVARPGALAALEAFNRGDLSLSHRSPFYGLPRFAEGGIVGAAPDQGPARMEATLGLEDGLVLKALDSREGDRLLVRMAARNRRAIGRVMGG